MSDKDQFTFEDEDDFSSLLGNKEESPKFDLGDDDDFPETDLSSAFSDGEVEAENPVQDVEEPAPKQKKGLFGMKKAGKPKKEKKPKEKKPQKEKTPKPKKEKKAGGSSSSSRLLLVVLLVVVAGAAGAYYFMGLGETTPAVPTVPAPVKKETKPVALPPKPASTPAPAKPQVATAPVPAKPAAPEPAKPASSPAPAQQVKTDAQPKPVAVAVPPPPKPQAAPAPAEKPAVAAQTQPAPAKPAVAPAPAAAPEPAKQPAAQVAVPAPTPAPVPQPAPAPVEKKAVAAPVPTTPAPAAPVKQVAGGAYALDAGSYLYESNRDMLVAKLKELGYDPLVTPVDATLEMTRLRLGTFSKSEVKEALAFARSIEPGSYSSPAGDNYVIYAGTFLKSGNVEKLKQRFLDEGIKVYAEPVEVVRTLSRIRFGSFATKQDAAAAAEVSGKAGVKAVVVKSK